MLQRTSKIIQSSLRYTLRTKLDYSKVPKLVEADLQEQFVRGGGPGGQAVNKTANCVFLKHLPTGISVKCHQSRSLDENRKTARELLICKLDLLVNAENSIEGQQKRIDERRSARRKLKQDKLNKLKLEWKQCEDN